MNRQPKRLERKSRAAAARSTRAEPPTSRRPALTSHVVVNHIADGSTPWINLEWLDPTLEKLRSKNNARFCFEHAILLNNDGQPKSENHKRVWYKPAANVSKRKFDDVFKLVDHLWFAQNQTDIEKIKNVVSDARVLEDNVQVEAPQKRSYPLMMAPPVLTVLPEGFKDDFKGDIENTIMEMTNYAIKCVSDHHLYLDEHLNLDLTELLPGEPPVEPSTDHTSSKKKDRNFKTLDREGTPNERQKNLTKNDSQELNGLRLIKEDHGLNSDSQMQIRRRLMKTAGQSPQKIPGHSLNLGEESIPRQLEIDKYLVKRAPQQEIQMMAPPKVDKVSNKKPTYVSRNASPPRSLKTINLDRDHPLNRQIDLSKTVKGGQSDASKDRKISIPFEPKLDPQVEQVLAPKESTDKEQQATLVERSVNEPPANIKTSESKPPTTDKKSVEVSVSKNPGPSAIAPSKVKQSCEQRVELTEWPSETAKPANQKSSLFGHNIENVGSKYALLNSGHALGALRNMSGPPRKIGEHINK